MMQAYNSFDYPHHPHHPYLAAPDGSQNFTNGFSRGSSSFAYPHQDYRYFVDRGELAASRLCTTSLVDNSNSLDATGIGFAGNPSSGNAFIVPEDISVVYNQWDWSPAAHHPTIVAPAPVYPAPQAFPSVKSARNPSSSSSIVCSPTAQLPTPAAMAVLLNPNGRSSQVGDQQQSQSQLADYDIPQGSAAMMISYHTSVAARPIRPVEPVVAVQGVPDSPSREKKHACTMCHKRFDRPSTLRKHLLVHTGEKAFVCATCGRRFGVASNLNRHVKRCILKPVNSPSSSHKSTSGSPPANSPTSSSQPVSSTSTPTPSYEGNASVSRTGKRTRVPISPSTSASSPSSCSQSPPNANPGQTTSTVTSELVLAASSSSSSTTTRTPKPPGQKRRRRAPSPSQWIPGTLQNFNLHSEDSYRATTVPLPPVRRNLPREERNSWDENVNHAPYHPCGWSGTLPGPGLGQGSGLGGKDVRNMNFGGRSGFMLGRVLVF